MTATHIDCTLTEYHAMRDSWSHSQIETLIESPPLFHGRHITGLFPRESSDALDCGTIAHQALLMPGGLADVLAIIPREVLNEQGHRKGKRWLEWSDANADKIQMKPEEAAVPQRMVESVLSHEYGGRLRGAATHIEYTLSWECSDGLTLRCRPDWIAETPVGLVVCDLKTTRATTPREFAADAVKFGYHRQAAWYLDGVQRAGMDPKGFVFVVVDKSPAHECYVYQLSERAIELGRKQNADAVRELAYRLERNDWRGKGAGEMFELDLPEWAYREDAWK